MDTKQPQARGQLKRAIFRALLLLGVALGVSLFIERPPSVRVWMWWTLRVAVVVLAALDLAHAVLRWRRYTNK